MNDNEIVLGPGAPPVTRPLSVLHWFSRYPIPAKGEGALGTGMINLGIWLVALLALTWFIARRKRK